MPGSSSWLGLGAQFAYQSAPDQAAPQREGQALRVVGVAHHRRHLGQPVLVRAGQQRGQHLAVLRMAVVVGQPHPIGTERQRVQDTERETACAAEVSARRQIRRRDGLAGHQIANAFVGVVVDHDQLVGQPALGAQHVERLGQFVGSPVGDHDRRTPSPAGLMRASFRRAPRARAGPRRHPRTPARRPRCRRSA